MLLLPVALYGLYYAIAYHDAPGIAYFVVLTAVIFLGAWDALND